MINKFTPNRTMLLIKLDKLSDKNENGFVVSSNVEPATRRGVVISCGGEYITSNGERIELFANTGDIVILRNSIIEYGIIEGKEEGIICINDKDILCKIEGS